MTFIQVGYSSFWWKVTDKNLTVWKSIDGKKGQKAVIGLCELFDISPYDLENAQYKGYFQVTPKAVRRFIQDVYDVSSGCLKNGLLFKKTQMDNKNETNSTTSN